MSSSYYLYILYYKNRIVEIKEIDKREKFIDDFIQLDYDLLIKIDIYHFSEYENFLRKITTQYNRRKLRKNIDKLKTDGYN
jgi:hypothetical protein